ncbi:LANO_0H02300g1_1 [Lachancea nothofagi CBS 11611]|uniref:LANO_0H02300g1_1 n=1 Tax=Lachancea nothofagi CBS 11611 TaxID=1266666 RepID=A0A1G4KL54_9SACH|nr:LANO_0H02300g1_1 [Lachancea nothofagi CBS 11611]
MRHPAERANHTTRLASYYRACLEPRCESKQCRIHGIAHVTSYYSDAAYFPNRFWPAFYCLMRLAAILPDVTPFCTPRALPSAIYPSLFCEYKSTLAQKDLSTTLQRTSTRVLLTLVVRPENRTCLQPHAYGNHHGYNFDYRYNFHRYSFLFFAPSRSHLNQRESAL